MNEKEFLQSYDKDKYERPAGYTSDIAVFTITPKDEDITIKKGESSRDVQILLIKRKEHPFKGHWALPGGFVQPNESSWESANRELEEETGVNHIHIKHFNNYDRPHRDPRGWIISSAHYALVHDKYLAKRKANDDAEEVKLFSIEEVAQLKLAFDHYTIIMDAYHMVKRELIGSTIAKEFLNKEFILSDLYDVLLSMFQEKEIGAKSNFFRKAKSLPFIEPVKFRSGEAKTIMTSRPTQLYRFKENNLYPSIYR